MILPTIEIIEQKRKVIVDKPVTTIDPKTKKPVTTIVKEEVIVTEQLTNKELVKLYQVNYNINNTKEFMTLQQLKEWGAVLSKIIEKITLLQDVKTMEETKSEISAITTATTIAEEKMDAKEDISTIDVVFGDVKIIPKEEPIEVPKEEEIIDGRIAVP